MAASIKKLKNNNNTIFPVTITSAVVEQGSQKLETILHASTDGGDYKGKDLSQAFSSEISSAGNVWTWIQKRIQAENFSGIHIGDYIPVTLTQYTDTTNNTGTDKIFNMRVMGINTYYNGEGNHMGSSLNSGPHIDFIADKCIGAKRMNATNTNQSTNSIGSVWNSTELYRWLNSTVINMIQTKQPNLYNVIVNKPVNAEIRYSSSNNKLTESTGTPPPHNAGKIWIPSEYEVTGSIIWGTHPWSGFDGVQYPLFHNWRNRVVLTTNNTPGYWWTRTPVSKIPGSQNSITDDSAASCFVCINSNDGHVTKCSANSNSTDVSLCFRVA